MEAVKGTWKSMGEGEFPEGKLTLLPDYPGETLDSVDSGYYDDYQRGYRCEICFSLPSSKVAKMRSCEKCSAVTCSVCFKAWLETKIFSGQGAVDMRCISCTESVSDSEVLDLCGERTYKKLLYFRSRAEYRNVDSALWCPTEGCWRLLRGKVQIESSSPAVLETIISCPDCRQRTCTECGAPDHGDKPCVVPKADVRKTTKARMWTRLHTKTCPDCSAPIQRTGGCKHMKCAVCNMNFCWVCKGGLQEFQAPQTKGRRCICNRVSGVVFWSTFGVLGVVALPVVGAVAICASPPAAIWYATASNDKRERVRDHIRTLFVTV